MSAAMPVRLFFIISLLLPLSFAFAAPALLSLQSVNSSAPSLSVLPGGTIDIAWAQTGANSTNLTFAIANNRWGGFGAAELFSPGENSTPPEIAADSNGGVSLFWSQDGSLYCAFSQNGGQAWDAPQSILFAADSLSAVAGRTGSVGLIWLNGGALYFGEFSNCSKTGGLILDEGQAAKPRILPSPKGGFGVVWVNRTNSEIFFADTASGKVADVSNTVGDSDAPDFAFDSAGIAHIAWRD